MQSDYPKLFTDQLQRTLTLTAPARRIISLVPSQTELLFDLGLNEEVAGITRFCIHPPEWFKTKVRVGGTKQLNLEKIAALKPDLIIGNKEENEEHSIKALMRLYPVWMSDVKTLDEALEMIGLIGSLTNRQKPAEVLRKHIKTKFNALDAQLSSPEFGRTRTAAYFIWQKPYMVAGHTTFIHEMLKCCSLKNVFSNLPSRYPEITEEQLVAANPEVLLLSSEPYPFKEKHLEAFRKLLPQAKIRIVDGELFSWYGSRLLHTPEYLYRLYHTLNT